MAIESEEILNNSCNLIKNENYIVFRKPENNALFVIDTEIQFGFDEPNEANATAVDSFNSGNGCANCPIYGQCLPTPAVIGDTSNPEEIKLVPAQKTSFD
ncbi:MAG TPA: hypothetical protein VKC53_04490 [Patescibacteria group bacterium]|nr:hypothetical protein [Patescibacteria group bacterium]